jgi:putative PIN family toxin of toxin-antitoxin system
VEPTSPSSPPAKVVFDCNIFLQFLLNPNGPASRCVGAALDHTAELVVSDAVLNELRELPEKPVAVRNNIDELTISRFIKALLQNSTYLPHVPVRYLHPIDPDDSAYVNLALAANAKVVVSRDRHLLNLNNPAKPWSAPFRAQFPDLRVVTAEEFLRELDAAANG